MQCVEGECQLVCDCLSDADCMPAGVLDLCNGMLVCGLTLTTPCECEFDPSTVVACPAGQFCVPATGLCCTPDCAGKECGDDGCGGNCGGCDDGNPCTKDVCLDGFECGHQPDLLEEPCCSCSEDVHCDDNDMCTMDACVLVDGCFLCVSTVIDCNAGNPCTYETCDPSAGCETEPLPDGTACGDKPSDWCSAGQCMCHPTCGEDGYCGCEDCDSDCTIAYDCGPDGCGGTCGECPEGTMCQDHFCVCLPQCAGKECGPDGCGGTCGPDCGAGKVCLNGMCTVAEATCDLLPTAGCCDGEKLAYCDNGLLKTLDCAGYPKCGWHQVLGWYECSTDGQPDPTGEHPMNCTCTPNCADKQCGDDGCGGSCGECDPWCGDGLCGADEGCLNCPEDCGWCIPPCDGANCGNSKLDPGEECDDGNCKLGDGCAPLCVKEFHCGNGKLEPPWEECDDGNNAWGDACSPICKIVPVCGNGKVEKGEKCDDGNNEPGDECSPDCKCGTCGNGKLDPGESCDDGNCLSCDGCSDSCQNESFVCGNGKVEACNDEQCDDGGATIGECGGCDEWCQKTACGGCWPSPCCGDGMTDPGEDCDDGNAIDGDGCSKLCTFECAAHDQCAADQLCLGEPGELAPKDVCGLCGELEACRCGVPSWPAQFVCTTDADCEQVFACGDQCDDCPVTCPKCVHGWCAYETFDDVMCLCTGCA